MILRRLVMLQKLVTGLKELGGKRIRDAVSSYVLILVEEEDDESLTELSQYAGGIDDDIKRTFKWCQSTNRLEFNYQGGIPRM